MSRPCISFLSDFGQRDYYVASVKGVILDVCPEATIVDISHAVEPHNIVEAAFTLAAAYSCFPLRSLHLVVVDPGVGSDRKPIIAWADEHAFVAPDNGVLSLIFERETITEVVEIQNERFFRKPVSPTFHGRDIFAPVIAHLARGVPLTEFGPVSTDFVTVDLGSVRCADPDTVRGAVIHIDHFGNVITNIQGSHLSGPLFGTGSWQVEIDGKKIDKHYDYYAEAKPDEIFSIMGSSGHLEVAACSSSAARLLGVRVGAEVRVRSVLQEGQATRSRTAL